MVQPQVIRDQHAIEAFKGLDAVDVFILYPRGRVSEVQRRQMSTPSATNVHAISIDGDFDDCQKELKRCLQIRIFQTRLICRELIL